MARVPTLRSLALVLLLAAAGFAGAQTVERPYRVTVADDKTELADVVLPVDPQVRINLQSTGNMGWGLTTPDGKRLTFSAGSARTWFRVDGQVHFPGATNVQALPPGPRGQQRTGQQQTWQQGDLVVTQEQVIVPTKLPGKTEPGQKRKMDAVLIRYVLENKGQQPLKVGLKVRIDMYNNSTDGPVFWAPDTKPNQILDGTVIEGKDVPPYLVNIEHANLQNPGHLAYFTFDLGKKYERPAKVIATWHGAADLGWDVQAQASNGDSDIALFWDDQVIPAGKTREIVYAYGTGVATNPENEGKVSLLFSGSFEPKRPFKITAYVDDPVEGQSLRLVLPDGVERLVGDEIQPVPTPGEENRSIVVWQAQILCPGTFPLRIQSSNGVTRTTVLKVEKK